MDEEEEEERKRAVVMWCPVSNINSICLSVSNIWVLFWFFYAFGAGLARILVKGLRGRLKVY